MHSLDGHTVTARLSENTEDPGLWVDEDLSFQRRWWVVERISWALMVTALVAASIGAFGKGPLSQGMQVSSGGEVVVWYERIARLQAPSKLRVRGRRGETSKPLEIVLPRSFLDHMRLTGIEPAPSSVRASGEGVVYAFQADHSADPVEVTFLYKLESWGSVAGAVQSAGGSDVRFSQFVLP